MPTQLTLDGKSFIELNQQLNKSKKRKRIKKEENLQIQVCRYLRLQYPDVIFSSDVASGMKMPIWIAAKCKDMRSQRGLPDLFIMEPRGNYNAGTYKAGLAIELKNKPSDVFLKDGITISDTKSNKHVLEQNALLKKLRDKNYFATFAFGFQDCKKIIDTYMSL